MGNSRLGNSKLVNSSISQPTELPISQSTNLLDRFTTELTALSGNVYQTNDPTQSIIEYLISNNVKKIYLQPNVLEENALRQAGIDFTHDADPTLTVGVTKAWVGLADTGSVLMADEELLGSLLPEVHIAVLRSSDIVPSLSDAISMVKGKNAVFITAAVLLLSASCVAAQTRQEPPLARKQAACAEPPVRRLVLLSLFDLVSLVTGPLFSFFPALGGADKTRFVNDRLINRDELTHLIAFLEFQVNGPDKLLPPERAALHTQLLGAAQSLRENFGRLATHTDAGGSRAIGPEAVRRHPCFSSRQAP